MIIHENCKLCNLGVGLEPGLSQRAIAKKYGIGKSSVQRHITHYKKAVADGEVTGISAGDLVEGTISASALAVGSLPDNGEREIVTEDTTISIEDLIRSQGDDPASVEVTSKEVKTRELQDGKTITSLRVLYRPLTIASEAPLDIQGLFDRAQAATPSESRTGVSDRALVVVWADPQTGKVDRNGGTTDLIERIKTKQEILREYAKFANAGHAFFLDAGDGIEGFENTGQQQHTNDLSLMEQVELESTFEMTTIQVLAETHDNVQVAGIPSNHSQWRSGKALLGKPSDDWGIHIKKQLEKAFSLNPEAFGHVGFQYPDTWSELMTVDVLGHGVGLTHGHQVSKPELLPAWWGQQLQAGELWDAEVLVHGHFHHLNIKQCGRHPRTKKEKYLLGAPALDNGSAWVGNLNGATSDAGLMAFVVERGTGFVFNSLAVL